MEDKFHLTEDEKIAKEMARTPTERFRFLMKLIRINSMLQNAKIVHVAKEGKYV